MTLEPAAPAHRLPASQWQEESRLAGSIAWMAGVFAVIVALAGPLGYFWLSVQAEKKESAVAARLHAVFVIQAIADPKSNWREAVGDLIQADLAPGTLPEQRQVVDTEGKVVAVSGPDVAAPVLTQSAPLISHEGPVGEILVLRSARPLLVRSGVVALLSAALGAAIYLSLMTLPMRALRRTLDALKREEAMAREEAEGTLRVVFEQAVEGIILHSLDGRVLLSNPAAAQMYGCDVLELPHKHITDLLQAAPEAAQGEDVYALGQREAVARRTNGDLFPVDIKISETRVAGELQRIAIVRDISERKQHEIRVTQLANYDTLTGLPNRNLFRDRLHHAMARGRRSGRPMALMFLDLDRFKTINDSLGHEVGDKLLVQVSALLSSCLREADTLGRLVDGSPDRGVYRLGGDEFTVLVEDLPSAETASIIARRILNAFTKAFHIDGEELFISTSIGITLYPQENTDLDGLIKQADMAMYRAKELGRDTFFFYSEGLDVNATERHTLEANLRHALERNEFHLQYQPKADLATGEVTGVEALLRWRRPGMPPIGPDKFIPILEDTGLIVPVGAWVLRRACEQMVEWQARGLPPMNMAVNLSARQFRQRDLIEHIQFVLADTGLPPEQLEIELTESMLIEDSDAVVGILGALGAMGVRVAIDDFGTGHSSLSYLKRFHLDTLKIDRSFVRDIPEDTEDCAIATAIIALAHSLKLKVVAEGIETEDQLIFLRDQGCDDMQGYFLSKPQDPDVLATWLEQRRALTKGDEPVSA